MKVLVLAVYSVFLKHQKNKLGKIMLKDCLFAFVHYLTKSFSVCIFVHVWVNFFCKLLAAFITSSFEQPLVIPKTL